MLQLQTLNEEILNQIFKFLPPEDISSLFLTCVHFNQTIASSYKLMRGFTLHLTKERSGKRFRATRKYKSVKIHDTHGFLHIFDQIGKNVERIEVDCEEVNVSSLRKILLMCPNLKEVTIRNFKEIRRYEDIDGIEPPKLLLNFLSHRCQHSILDLFEHSQVKKLEVYGYPKVAEDLNIFLQTQKCLLSLKFAHFYADSTLFMDNTLNMVQFHLNKLELHSFHKFDIDHFGTFLMNHIGTLTHVELNNVDTRVFMILTHFMNLKSCDIRNIKGTFVEMPYMEKVRAGSVSGNWEKKFKNAKIITKMSK